MNRMTEESLKASFAGESQAHLKYLAFAERAERDGLARIARLFRAAAYAEQIHAAMHLRTLRGVGSTAENLRSAIAEETFEAEEMYPAYEAVANLQGEKLAAKSFQRALGAEMVHAELYGRAAEAVALGGDVEIGRIVVCDVCGHTAEGEPPEKCPYCLAPRDRFTTF